MKRFICTIIMTVGWWGILYLFALLTKCNNPIQCANTAAIFGLLCMHFHKVFEFLDDKQGKSEET